MPSISDFAEQKPEENDPWQVTTETPTPTKVVTTPVTTTQTTVAVTPSAPAPAPTPNVTASVTATPSQATNTDEILQSLMSKIAPIGTRSYLKILIYGDPGSTKSSFAATAPNNLVVDLEDGMIAAKNSPNGIAENVQTVRWNEIGGFAGFGSLVQTFQRAPEELKVYETLTVDSFSEAHKRGLAEVTEREFRKRPSKNRYVPETEEQMENNERMIRILRAIRDMDRNLILIAHARTIEPKNKPAKTFPDFSESLANKIEAMMDVVGYMTLQEVEKQIVPVMVLKAAEGIHCKTRVGLPDEIINPTYAKIKEAWDKARLA